MIEQDAWAKASLAERFCEKLLNEATHDNNTIKNYLCKNSKTILHERMHENKISYHEWYVSNILTYCENVAEWHKGSQREKLEFVRLEHEDLWALGNNLDLTQYIQILVNLSQLTQAVSL